MSYSWPADLGVARDAEGHEYHLTLAVFNNRNLRPNEVGPGIPSGGQTGYGWYLHAARGDGHDLWLWIKCSKGHEGAFDAMNEMREDARQALMDVPLAEALRRGVAEGRVEPDENGNIYLSVDGGSDARLGLRAEARDDRVVFSHT